MEIVHERCAGLDVHKKTVVACVVTPEHKEVRTFGTLTRELMGMADWFSSLGVTHVAMESTGVYWRAIVRREALCNRVGRKESHLQPVAAGC